MVLGEKWIWATLIIRKVGDNKPWFSVEEDVVAIDLEQLIQRIALTHQFKSSKHLSFVRPTFGLCTILDAHHPAVLSLVDVAFCCILRRFAVISPQRGTDVPDNSIPRLFSSRHTHSEQLSQKLYLCWASDKNANYVTDAPTLHRVWNDYKEPRPWESISTTHEECNSPTLQLTSARPRSHVRKHANTRRLSCQRGLLFILFFLSLSDGYSAALGSVRPDIT